MARAKYTGKTVHINGVDVAPGTRKTLPLPVAMLYTRTPVEMPVNVINGRNDGPRLFVTAAIHGDELNGIEIIRRLRKLPALKRLRGTLMMIPIVNSFGVLQHSRYLPDRRDLNRCFPGSESGSLAARLANLLMTEIVSQCTHGIDLHTAAIHRSNLPQIRCDLSDPETERLARAFGAPVIIDAQIRDGSLRGAAADLGVPTLLYEAGEALRFDEICINGGVRGILNVMRELGMLPPSRSKTKTREAVVARSSSWLRSPEGGLFRSHVRLGARVNTDDLMGTVTDPFSDGETELLAHTSGIVIGRGRLPLVNEGDALFHIARMARPGEAAEAIKAFAHAGQQEEGLPENESAII
ncbi:MAG: succinylglutamate desuccinylase/aspartoacylase family protein [Gammaproteobacteria bacterium]